jgi:hypothetical protein
VVLVGGTTVAVGVGLAQATSANASNGMLRIRLNRLVIIFMATPG